MTAEKLQSRIIGHNSGDCQKDALHLCAEKKFVNEHNNKILGKMPGEKVMKVFCLQTFLLKSART